MKFTSAFLTPILLIVAGAIASLFGGLFVLTGIQDDMESVREQKMAATVVGARVDYMRRLAIDYGVWDEAARKLVLGFDADWADQEIGVFLHEQYDHEASFIVDDAGRSLYGVVGAARSGADPARTLGSGYAAAAAGMLARAKDKDTIAGISLAPRGPIVFSMSRIASASDDFRAVGPRRYLVISKAIDAAMVGELRQAMQGPPLTLRRGHVDGPGHARLRAYDGGTAGSLSWTPSMPGTHLREQLLPWLTLLCTGIVGLALFVLRRARLGARQLLASEVKALHLANHDVLTGLPNRRAFVNHLLRLSREGRDYSILYMDLDGFKEVNDTYGHGTGDALLRATSERLGRIAPADAFLARLGGDEFAVVKAGDCPDDALGALADAILRAVRGPQKSAGDAIVIGASIGIARCEGCEYEDVVRRADIAMYAAKARGRDTWCLFEPTLDDGRQDRRALEADLRHAIDAGDLTVAFQPIIRVSTGEIASMEALARWTHPDKGPIEPDIFIPVAEESGLIVALGKHVLREACLAARDWPYKLAVNLSPAQFWDRSLVAGVIDILRECDFPPERLEFEITETYLLRRPDAAAEVIAQLRAHGIRIALDDFGTGYASIAYLRRFNLDQVKLDRSFVEGIANSTEAADVALAIIALSGALNLTVVAEGVESEAQASVLTVAGCDYLQGWHYGRPVTAAAVDQGLLIPEIRSA